MSIKTEINLEEVTKLYKLRKFKNLEVRQRISDGFVNLSDLLKFLNGINKTSFSLRHYLSSKNFYLELLEIDTTLTNKSNVYLLYFEKEEKFKIGRTFDISQRYSQEIIRNNLYDIVPVENDCAVEKELITFFSERYENVGKSKETFKLTCQIDRIKRHFRSIIQKYILGPENFKSKLINFPNPRADDRTVYGHVEVANILTNHFSTNIAMRRNWDFLFLKLKHEIPNSTIDFVENIEEKSTCLFWYFSGYLIIKDIKTDYYNGSRLVNSISKADGKKKNFFDLTRNKPFIEMCDEFKKIYGKDPIMKKVNKTQPALNGWWVHEYLVESVIRWLSPRHALLTNVFLTETKKILAKESLTPEEKIQKIQDLMLLTILNRNEGKINILDISQFKIGETFHDVSKIRMLKNRTNISLFD